MPPPSAGRLAAALLLAATAACGDSATAPPPSEAAGPAPPAPGVASLLSDPWLAPFFEPADRAVRAQIAAARGSAAGLRAVIERRLERPGPLGADDALTLTVLHLALVAEEGGSLDAGSAP